MHDEDPSLGRPRRRVTELERTDPPRRRQLRSYEKGPAPKKAIEEEGPTPSPSSSPVLHAVRSSLLRVHADERRRPSRVVGRAVDENDAVEGDPTGSGRLTLLPLAARPVDRRLQRGRRKFR